MTYFAGTDLSSIGPFKSVAMLLAAALASSWPLEIERVLISSSSTPIDLEVSFAEAAGVESITSTAGISGECLVISGVIWLTLRWEDVGRIFRFNRKQRSRWGSV
jgi:hypothetical protein